MARKVNTLLDITMAGTIPVAIIYFIAARMSPPNQNWADNLPLTIIGLAVACFVVGLPVHALYMRSEPAQRVIQAIRTTLRKWLRLDAEPHTH